jgi:hypothetical protein
MNIKPGRFLYLSDKDIFDGLCSSKKHVTFRFLKGFFEDRGIFVSEKISREGLISELSMLNLDYYDVQGLLDQLASSNKNEKTRQIDLPVDIDVSDLMDVVSNVEEERSSQNYEGYKSNVITGTDRVAIDVEYEEIDLSRTRLRQRKPKDAKIEIERIDSGVLRLRFPDNEKSESIVDDLKKRIFEKTKTNANEKKIDLYCVSNIKLRTQFFIDLLKSIEYMILDDVIKITVDSRIPVKENNVESEQKEVGEQVRQQVNKAALSGSQLLSSETYEELDRLGFYISRIVWHMIEDSSGEKVGFEAFFSDAPACTKFASAVTGYFPTKGSGHILQSKRLSSSRQHSLAIKLESAAFKSYENIMKLHSGDLSEPL